MASLSDLITSMQRGFLKEALTGAGLTLGTSAVLLTMVNNSIDYFKDSLGSIAASVLQLGGLAGFDVAISLVLGAITARYVQNSAKVYLQRR